MMRDSQRFATIMVGFIIGFVTAIAFQLMVDNNIILPDLFYNTITLRAVQFMSIFLWTLFGAVLSATR